jgi:hypothetical protein
MTRWLLTGCCLCLEWSTVLAGTPAATSSSSTYARQLLEQTSKANPDLLGATISAASPQTHAVVVVASTEQATIGAPADRADIAVMSGGTTAVVGAGSTRVQVRLQLHDVSGDTVGALRLSYAFHAGQDVAAVRQNAERLRDRLQRRISHAGNLFDPVPYEADAPAGTYTQQLVDEFIDKHPEIEILAIHVTPPESDYNIIAGSNIGRLGKKADNDDMRCVFTGKPNLEVNSTGKRFESEMQLHDRSGQVIGAVGVVVAYKKGDDKQALFNHAEQIRAELEKRIPDSASLFRSAPQPAVPSSKQTVSAQDSRRKS